MIGSTTSHIESLDSDKRSAGEGRGGHTRYNVTSIHGILIFDEAKAVHQLDLRNLTGAMSTEVFLDILFGDCRSFDRRRCQLHTP